MSDLIATSILAADSGAAAAKPAGMGIEGKLAMLFLLCLLPYVVGAVLARALRLKEFSNRISTVLLAFTLGLAPFVYHIVTTGNPAEWKEAIRFGIDLAGGTNLIYQVKTDQAIQEKKPIDQAMTMMVGTIAKRVNPSGTEEVSVRKVGQDRIEIIIPGADPSVVEEKKKAMTRLGSLEFGICANSRDHNETIRAAEKLSTKVNEYVSGGKVVAVWRDVSPNEDIPTSATATLGSRDAKRTHKDKNGNEKPVTQLLILHEAEQNAVTGKYLTRASIGLSDEGTAAVNFSFNSEGAMRFFRLTDRNKPLIDGHKRQLAIILDGQVHSAPNLNSAIRDNGQITGNFSSKELQALVGVLNAGALELPIDPTPISEFSISPLLGEDVQHKGMLAIWISAAAVFVFMLVYYRFAGFVADISLILNLVLIVGLMAICNATFTLPGLAGLVLTIGMAVDTNVLIYERMREEMARGSSLRMVIHNGFDKALSAIVDSNITTLIAAVILYMIGTDQIRGFAVSLFIGITMSMFSALYFGHLMFDLAERLRLIRNKLKMFQVIGVTKFDFISKMKTAITFSVTFIAIGVAMVFARGDDSLDIDFSGGSMVTFKFEDPQQIDDVRGKLSANPAFGTSMILERLALPTESALAEKGRQFRLRTKVQDIDKIRKGIAETFVAEQYKLHRVTVEFTAPIVISAAATPAINAGVAAGSTSERAQEKSGDQPRSAQGDDELKSGASQDEPKKAESDKKPDAQPEKKNKTPVSPKSDDERPAAPKADEKAEKTGTPPKLPAIPPTGSTPPAETQEPETTEDQFANGYRSELTFSSEVSPVTAADYVRAALSKNKGSEIEAALIRVKGTSGSGLDAAEGKAKTFDKMLLEANASIPADDLAKALADVKQTLATTPIFEEVNNFASSVAEDMRYLAILALLTSGVATVIYLWFRFTKADFGLAAVVAVFHDVMFVLACLPMASFLARTPIGPLLGLDDFKLNLSIVAAFLTIIGYSLNDTIVIFDRVREIRGRNPLLTPQMVNDSVNQTLSRTILTALTVFITVAILYAVGGEGIHGFAFCMLVGTLVGTYSTVFIASPFLLWMMNREQQKLLAQRR